MRIFLLELVPNNLKVNFIKLRRINYILSILLTILSILSIAIYKLNFGIDFIGGINIEARLSPKPNIEKIRFILNELHSGEIVIQNFGDDIISIRASHASSNDSAQHSIGLADRIKMALEQKSNYHVEYRKVDIVGPQVGSYLIRSGVQALFLALIGIMIYIWCRFEWKFGVGVLIALLHDLILALGFASVSKIEFNLSSIAALLTIIGYSVNDSVVIYDRIRENMKKLIKKDLREIINISINETLPRTTLTVFTTLLANIALIFFGGEAIRSFSILVFIGIIIGTYSSIFISAPILTLFKIHKR